MPADYTVLASIYDQIGMSDFAAAYTQPLIVYAQQNDWLGRQILELGCGTGATVRWLGNHGYNVTGVDQSPEMLTLAQRSINATGLSIQWQQADMRNLDPKQVGSGFHMALALDIMNEVNSLRDLEMTFNSVGALIDPDKLLVFDLYTIQGLAERGEGGAEIVANDEKTFITADNQYDYERQALNTVYHIFRRQANTWTSATALRTLRAFPVQAVVALLGRFNFGIMALLNLRFEAVELNAVREPRVIIMARKLGS
jgi:SAM-dependent methyltransferase